MKIVITGATGLIGGALGQRLVAEGHHLVALVRSQKTHVPFPCEKFVWDGEHSVAPTVALWNADAVFHLSGENIAAQRWSKARKKQLVDSRVKGTHNLQQGLVQAGVTLKFFFGASATGFYGDRGEEELTESSPAGHDFLSELCQEWEKAHLMIPAHRLVIGRFGIVLSEGDGFLGQVAPLFVRVGGSALGPGLQWLSWIHRDDLIEILVKVLNDTNMQGVYNMVSPTPLRNQELTKILARRLKAFAAPKVPSAALKLVYGELSQALLGSQRVHPARLQAQGFDFQFKIFAAALEDLYGSLQAGEMKVVFSHWVNKTPREIWPFFSSETNLEELTPAFLHFKVIGKSTEIIGQGTLIDYRLKLRGIPLRWRTRINEWQKERCFVDEQLKGPYAKWHHTHEFLELGGGTLMRDTVRFIPPMGWLGRAVALPFVMKEVKTIFAYRSDAIDRIFSTR